MINWQETLLFPVRDTEARTQFLIACLVAFVGFFIPILPTLLLMGYGAKIMRQILEDRKSPSMPNWQGSDWSEMFLDGARLYGAKLVLMLPLFLFMGCGFISMIGGSVTMSIPADDSGSSIAPLGILLFTIGIGFMLLFALLSPPYGIIISAAGPHVATKRSFAAAFQFKEWWAIFRKGLTQFILGYVVITVMSFVFIFVIQIALITLILMCIVPFIMIPYSVYLILMTNTLFAQAYAAGRDTLQTEQHATA